MKTLPSAVLLVAVILGCGRAGDLPPGCTQSVAAFCAAGQGPCQYASFVQASGASCDHVLVGRCGDYDVAVERGVDAGATSYFDPASGALVAVTRYGPLTGMQDVCEVGPTGGFAAPKCAPGALQAACATGP